MDEAEHACARLEEEEEEEPESKEERMCARWEQWVAAKASAGSIEANHRVRTVELDLRPGTASDFMVLEDPLSDGAHADASEDEDEDEDADVVDGGEVSTRGPGNGTDPRTGTGTGTERGRPVGEGNGGATRGRPRLGPYACMSPFPNSNSEWDSLSSRSS
jgi:hypothetical protein